MTYAQRLERLVDVVQELSLTRDMDGVAHVVRKAARELVGADGATFVLRDGDRCFYKDEDAIAPLWKGQRFPMSACISGWVMQHREPTVIEDIYADSIVPHDAYRPTFVKSLVMVPIRTRDPIGAIGTYWATMQRPRHNDVRLLCALADATSVAIENAQVYEALEQRVRERTAELAAINEQLSAANAQLQTEIGERRHAEEEVRRLSLTDELTGLHNRRGFYLLAEHELEVARRQARTGALVFLDVDGLKRCNDLYGHAIGDALLVAAAELLRQVFRKTDVVARMGGDEFAVLVTDTTHAVGDILSRLRQAASALRGGGPALQFSVGAVALAEVGSLDQLLHDADLAMYADKTARRAAQSPGAAAA